MPSLDPGAGLTEHVVRLPDGRRIRTVTGGEAAGPLVVFEAGMSGPAASWVHTQRQVSAHGRTLSYDRAGYGGSDDDPDDRTLERMVDDLTSLLDAIEEKAPVVLVGHSWGGPMLRLFAERQPERVAGLVFIDSTLAAGMPRKNARLARATFAALAVVARFGGEGLIRKVTVPKTISPDISDEDLRVMWRDYLSARAMRTGAREAKQILRAVPTMRRLEETSGPAVPTVCVQGGRVDRGMTTLRPLMNETATKLMQAIPEGRVVVVDQAGHLVPQERPNEVRDAILLVLSAVTGRTSEALG